MVYDSNLETQNTAIRKMVKWWFGPYEILHVFPNATYKLCELDGTEMKVLIAGKRIKLFKKRDGQMLYEDLDKQQFHADAKFDMEQGHEAVDEDEDQDKDADVSSWHLSEEVQVWRG